MKKEAIFKKGLKELIETSSLEDITVVSLCDYVKSNRQTFYYHFRDLYDLLAAIMLREQINYPFSDLAFENMHDAIVKYINDNYRFLSEVKKSYAGDLIDNFIYSFIYDKLQQFYKLYPPKTVSKDYLLSMERCLSNVLSLEYSYHITALRKEGPQKIKKRLKRIWDYFTKTYLQTEL